MELIMEDPDMREAYDDAVANIPVVPRRDEYQLSWTLKHLLARTRMAGAVPRNRRSVRCPGPYRASTVGVPYYVGRNNHRRRTPSYHFEVQSRRRRGSLPSAHNE